MNVRVFGLLVLIALSLLPGSVLAYTPSSETLLNNSKGVSGAVSDLATNNAAYRTVRGYSSTFSGDVQTAISETESTYNAGTTYQDKTTLTWTSAADTYLIYATAEVGRTGTQATRASKAQLTIDGTSYGETFVTDDNDADNYRTFAAFRVMSLSAASHTVKIQYATTNTLNTAKIKNARIVAVRIGTNYQGAEVANSTTTSTTYADILSSSFTPTVTEDWLIMTHSEIAPTAATTDLPSVNFLVDGSQYAESNFKSLSTSYYLPADGMKILSLSAGSSHTVKIQAKVSSGTAAYRNVRMVALPLSLFQSYQSAESESETTCSTCTSGSPTDKATLTFTPAATSDYLILGNGEINTTSGSVYVVAQLTVDGTVTGASVIDVNVTTQYPGFAIHKVANLSNASHTLKIQLYTQTSGTTVKIRDVHLFALRLPPASEQTVEVEYSGTSNTSTWSQLAWEVDSAWNQASVTTTLQVYKYSASAYPTSGDGYLSYTSSGTANTDEDKTQTITTSPTNFRDASGNWKIKITGVKTTTSWLEWKGDLVSYVPTSNGSLSVDIVDSGGSSVSSPSVSFSGKNFNWIVQQSTGTLGASAQKIRVTNNSGTASWTLTLSAASGNTALWTSGGNTYDFNGSSSAGRLQVNPSGGTITPQGGCASTGLSKGSSTYFAQGTVDSITLLSADGSAQTGCYWDFTGVALTQDIPASQVLGTYTLSMTLTAS